MPRQAELRSVKCSSIASSAQLDWQAGDARHYPITLVGSIPGGLRTGGSRVNAHIAVADAICERHQFIMLGAAVHKHNERCRYYPRFWKYSS